MKKSIYHIIYVFALAAILAGCGAEASIKKGDKFYALGEYYDAANKYKKAYRLIPPKQRNDRGKLAVKMAECYRRLNYSQRAIASYNNVIRYKQDDSLTHLYLAQQLMKTGSYRQAEKEFIVALDSMPGNRLAKQGLESSRKAMKWKEEGSRYTVKKENFFNSRRADYSPMLSGTDYDQLFYTTTRNQTKGEEYSGITGTKTGDIIVSTKDENGKWQKPEVIDTEVNTEYDEGACSFSPDQHTMYLTQCTTDPNYPRYATIITSNRSDAAWSKGTLLKISSDTLSSFAHPAVSPDGEWLYFVSDMPGGMGGFDIWRIGLTTSGVIGGVENLGPLINTPGDEMFPTFRPNGDLYFSSNGHQGLGGLDIFIAEPMNDTWIVEHPGYPLNSQGDDFGMTFEGMKNQGFFSSNRGDGKGWDHIYSFYNPEVIQTVKGWVYEQEGYELTDALVYMVGNDGTNVKLSVKGDGSFTQRIRPGVDYVLLGTCEGFLNHKEELHVDSAKESSEVVLQFELANITAPVLIDNIFYDFDKATLRPESATALDKLVKLLNDNPNVTIELGAHTDYKGSDEYNKLLSQRRAESVVSYLIAHGIASDRLTPKGYGEEVPKTIRKKLTESYPFLKENDVLNESFVTALASQEQQEQCNQLNRRTEFRVLSTTYGLFDSKGQLKNMPKPKPKTEASDEEQEPDFDFLF